ncbi:MAG: FHA domain-containing protein [Anaerolineae bacterium]|nr:FHA domain-containing protein [Anaerolineae bacterium]
MFPQLPFSRFETVAQRLVEGSFHWLFSGRIQLYDIALHLARALEDSQRDQVAANQYQVHLNPSDHETLLRESPDILNELTDYLTQLAQQTGVTLAGPAEITLIADERMRPQHVRVQAQYMQPFQDETTRVRRKELMQETLVAIQQLEAFLIVDGKRHIPLSQPVITIGRRTDNDIVLSLPDVSRQHAQIRWRFSRFVIYDLGSRAGTKLNGQRIQESVLQPGDVLTLSTATLIYGEGGESQPARRIPSSRPKEEATLVRPAIRRPKDGEIHE